jgi:peptide chain release factor 3
VLGIPCAPMTWPVGMGKSFQGVYERDTKRFLSFEREDRGKKAEMSVRSLDDPELKDAIGEGSWAKLKDEIALLDDAGNKFDQESFLAGEVTPVFFGSAMNNFGVEPFLDRFVDLCPPPKARKIKSDSGDVELAPEHPKFSAFVFKIQANMDPRHRDRIAFLRICSGRFERGMEVKLLRTGRKISLDRPLMFMAQERTTVEEAYSGDILGLWDPGNLRIGDTLTTADIPGFEGIPSFSPEHFVRVRLGDPLKRKQLQKGLSQLADEGAVQLLRERDDVFVDPVLGAVGWLQVEVVQHRLKSEYGVEAKLDRLPYSQARWVFAKDGNVDVDKLLRSASIECFYDVENRPLLLFENDWMRRRFEDKHPDLVFVAAVQPGRARA